MSLRFNITTVLATIALLCCTARTLPAQGTPPAGEFGFSDLLVFRLSSAGGPWHSTDLNGDGDLDLVVWDGNRGELVLLHRDPEVQGFTHREGGNTLTDPDGWSRSSIPSRAEVEAIGSGDLDGDGFIDLVFTCPNANRIEIRWGTDDENRFRTEMRIRLRDVARGDRTLDIEERGDDGAVIRVLSKEGIHEVRNLFRDGVPEILTLTGTAAGPSALYRTDLDGDGISDLLTVSTASADRRHPLRLRPGSSTGWGAEILIESEDSRLLGIASAADRSLLLMADRNRPVLRGTLLEHGSGSQILPSPQVHPLTAEGIGGGTMAIGDIDGDGDPDVIISDAKGSLLRPFWNSDGSLIPGSPSPTLKNPASIQIHGSDLFVTSSEEGGAGRSTREEDGFSFPELVKDPRIDSLIAIASSDHLSSPLIHLYQDEGAGRGKSSYLLDVGGGSDTGEDSGLRFQSDREPAGLQIFPGSEGRGVIVVQIPFQSPRFFRLDGSTIEPIEIPATVESGGSVEAGHDGQLLVAREGRCRIIQIEDGRAKVVRQIDAPGGSARIVAALPVRLEAQPQARMILVDGGAGLIHICNDTEVMATVEGPFQKVKEAATRDLDGDGFDEILILGERALMVIHPGEQDWVATEVFSRRHDEENGRITASCAGDLNGDGVEDLVVIDGVRGELEILGGGDPLFTSLLRFPVFEKKLFRGGGRSIEPRRVMLGDFDGDDALDAAILVHDRLIIYPQNTLEGSQ